MTYWRSIGEQRLADELAAILAASPGLDRSTKTISLKPNEPKVIEPTKRGRARMEEIG